MRKPVKNKNQDWSKIFRKRRVTQLSISFLDDELAELNEFAAENNLSVSNVVRQLLKLEVLQPGRRTNEQRMHDHIFLFYGVPQQDQKAFEKIINQADDEVLSPTSKDLKL